MPTPRSFDQLRRELAPERHALMQHSFYSRLTTVAGVRTFMEHHVFAVWDFMSLLKNLQRAFTCVEVPWTPRGDTTARRLINEIVLGEESDDGIGGGYTSHFELYQAAMLEGGADVTCIDALVGYVTRGASLSEALSHERVPDAARRFVESTFATIASGSIPRIAGAFTIGREEIIPDMFARLVADLSASSGGSLTLFVEYLERHIRVDAERHGPMAARLLETLCEHDEDAWSEALIGAREALVARRALWDGIARACNVPEHGGVVPAATY